MVREGCQGPRIGGRMIELDCFKKVSGGSGVRAHGESFQDKRGGCRGPKKRLEKAMLRRKKYTDFRFIHRISQGKRCQGPGKGGI